MPEDQQGLKVLGTPLGTRAFVRRHGDKRLQEEKAFWDKLSSLPDLQSAWLLLLNCAAPRSNYTTRTLPPTLAENYARKHDAGVWGVLAQLLDREDLAEELNSVHARLASLPLRLGGAGLRSADRTREAAYWASWADTLPMMAARCPNLCETFCQELESESSRAESLRQAAAARRSLVRKGYDECPTWGALKAGTRPPKPETTEPVEFAHGWQYHASSRTETHYREHMVFARQERPRQALLHSQAGLCAGTHLTALPLRPETKWKPAQLRALLLRRLWLPLHLQDRWCRCGLPLDAWGHHRAACGTAGVLQTRAVPLERMWRRVCREAGGRLRPGALKELNLGPVLPNDNRRLECVVDDLPLPRGGQVAVDCTLVSALKRSGEARPRAHREEGAALADSRKRKKARYPELVLPGSRCKLVFAGMEVGGRWAQEAYDFVKLLASAKARDTPGVLQGSTYHAWKRRWVTMLSVAGMRAFADSLLHGTASSTDAVDGAQPTLSELLGEEPHAGQVEASRLPLRS